MGEECPGGRLVFQTTLAAGPIALGKGRSRSGWPEQLTPRNCGQSEHSPYAASAKKPIPNRPVVFIMPPNRYVSAAQSHRRSVGRSISMVLLGCFSLVKG